MDNIKKKVSRKEHKRINLFVVVVSISIQNDDLCKPRCISVGIFRIFYRRISSANFLYRNGETYPPAEISV